MPDEIPLKSKVFLINLERFKERLQACTELLNENNVEFERITAVDGSHLSNEIVSELYNYTDSKSYYKELNKGEIGCYLSHKMVWQKIVEDELDFAIILEDDFQSCVGLTETKKFITQLTGSWDYIKLAEHSRIRKAVAVKSLNKHSICVYDKLPARTLAQAVSFKGAQKLLDCSKPILRPIDIDIQHAYEKSLIAFGIKPSPIKPKEKEVSEIDKIANRSKAKKNRIKQIIHQIKFKYRNFLYRKKLIQILRTLTAHG